MRFWDYESFKYFENRFGVTLCRKIEKYDELEIIFYLSTNIETDMLFWDY